MKISELILKLKEVENLNGDVDIIVYNSDKNKINLLEDVHFGYCTDKDDGDDVFHKDLKFFIDIYNHYLKYNHVNEKEYNDLIKALIPCVYLGYNEI